jgi:hypothetical protein
MVKYLDNQRNPQSLTHIGPQVCRLQPSSEKGFPRHAGLKVAVLKVLSAADVQNEAATAITQEIIHLRPSETPNDRDRW